MSAVISKEPEVIPANAAYKVYEIVNHGGQVNQYFITKRTQHVFFKNTIAHVPVEDTLLIAEMDELVKESRGGFRVAAQAYIAEAELDPMYALREKIREEERAKILAEQALQNVQTVKGNLVTTFTTSAEIFEGAANSNSNSGLNLAMAQAVAGAAKSGAGKVQVNLATSAPLAGSVAPVAPVAPATK